MKKVFTILITFLLALSLIGVASAADDSVVLSDDYVAPGGYDKVSEDGSTVDVHYTVSEDCIVIIPSDVGFTEGVYHIHDNVTVIKSHINNGKYLNVYVKSANAWHMNLLLSTAGGNVQYDDENYIDYLMRYDSDKNGVVEPSDSSLQNSNGAGPHGILSLQSGVETYRFAVGFDMTDAEFSKSGKYMDKLTFTISVEDSAPNGLTAITASNI